MQDEKRRANPFFFVPIGIIHSPFTDINGMPIQPAGARGIRAVSEFSLNTQTGFGILKVFPIFS